MYISKGCNNCIHLGINKNCLRYPPFEVSQKDTHTYLTPQESDGNVKLWQEGCGEHVVDFHEINRILREWSDSVAKERRLLKQEIKRLGGNPRKIKSK